MHTVPRPLPNEASARKHSVRAVVTGHSSYTTGSFWWQKTFPIVEVRILDCEYPTFLEIIRKECKVDGRGRTLEPSPQEISIGFKNEELSRGFVVGEEANLLFRTFGLIEQFYQGAPAHRWDGIQKQNQELAA